jgi:hypothetical protein
LVLERWGGHWLEGRILKLPLDKGDKFKEGSWEAYQVGGWWMFFLGEKKLEDERGKGVWKKELVLMCEGMLFMKERCANKEHGRKCV